MATEALDGETRLRAALSELVAAARASRGGEPRALPVAGGDADLGALRDLLGELLGAPAAGVAGEDSGGRPTDRAIGALRQRQSVLKYIISNLPHRIFWKDQEGRFLGGNENFLHDFGMSSEAELIGKSDYDMPFPREQAEFFRRIDRQVMDRGDPILDLEEPQLRPDGMHILSTSKVPLRDESGAVTGILGIFIDITERKKLEEALKRALDEAQAAARAKTEFVDTVSHELRTPLTLIQAPLQSLLEGPDAEARLGPMVWAHLERMVRNVVRLNQLVSDILDFSRLEAGRMPVLAEPVDVPALVSEIVDDATPTAEQRGLSLRFGSSLVRSRVTLDRRKLEKIALNLLGNALKFTPPGGEVEVGLAPVAVARAGEEARPGFELWVRDTGPGIPREQHGLLFRRFQQLDGSSTRKHEGSGIGLALVKEFATLMGGEVGVDSEPGRGSRFHVRLPHVSDGATSSRNRAQGVPPGSGRTGPRVREQMLTPAPLSKHLIPAGASFSPRRRRDPTRPGVLIADDSADLRAYLCNLLGDDYDVEAVSDGRAALAAARAWKPEVILSDVMMPEMDGLELVAQLKADPALRNIPVILLTAKAGREELVAGLHAGADDYLPKPFGPAELRARVLAARRLHRIYLDLEREHEALKEAQDQLVQAGKMAAIGTLVAGLAHEMNNPLSIILLHAQSALARRDDPAASTHALAAIEAQAQRCARLIAALLDFARKKPPSREGADMSVLIAHVIELVAAHARRRGVTLAVEPRAPADPAPPRLAVNVPEIESALLNVLTNGIDATPSGGRVSVKVVAQAREGRAGVEFEVRDQGCGIAPDALPRIFDPFFTLKPVGEGTGLGLSITRKIVDAHGGRIAAESAVGEGTTMRLWLPVADPPPSAGTAPTDPAGAAPEARS